jgi:hypothetical protein
VLSDAGNAVADRHGLRFTLDGEAREVHERVGVDLAATCADDSWTLPAAATFVIERDGTVSYADVAGDRRRRVGPDGVLAAVKLRRTERSGRYSAPTLLLRNVEGATAIVPGFQPFEAIDLALMNLEPRLTRLPVPPIETLLAAYPGGLTSQEVARALADTTGRPERAETERRLIALVAEGSAIRTALGDDALWTLAPEAPAG